METITALLEQAFRSAIREAVGIDADPLIAPAQNEKFGDYQSNAAMGLAKAISEKSGQKTNPRAVAQQILAKLKIDRILAEPPTIAGPGFINLRLSPAWLAVQLASLAKDDRLGIEKAPDAKRVVVDYSAPNIAK